MQNGTHVLTEPAVLLELNDTDSERGSLSRVLWWVLNALASLKFTVALMAMAIFLILAGTLAQIDKDIWQVMTEYFRTPLALIDLRVFFPRSWALPTMILPFPGGFTIGGAMLINLFAAHGLRFKIQARGTRLLAGLIVVAAGVALTWLVVVSGSNPGGLQDAPLIEWSTLWMGCKLALGALWLGLIVALVALDSSRQVERIGVAAATALLGALVVWLFAYSNAELGESSLRILWQLLKGGLAGLLLLAGCVLLFKKRAGVVLLHAGVALVMINELVVYRLHSEGQMHIREGQTINFVQDVRTVELAIVDPADPNEDQVVVIPKWMLKSALKRHKVLRDEALPFDVELVGYLDNTSIRELKPDEKSSADAGLGRKYTVDEVRPGAGTDTGGEIDMAAAYVRLLDKQDNDKPLGTFLVSLHQSLRDAPERVEADGKTYDVSLRFKRTYKPYSMHLTDVRFDKYMGTNTPRNYSSDLRLVDTGRNVDRKVHIWMNNPLRFAGETFYQSNFSVDPNSGSEVTGLNVVTNVGWMIPYVACMIVATGMLAHFSLTLLRFLTRRTEEEARAVKITEIENRRNQGPRPATAPGGSGSLADWALPLVVVGLAAMFIYSVARTKPVAEDEFDLAAFGRLPVMYEGRMKPIDTLARNSLRVISDTESYVDAEGDRQPAVKWLLDVIVRPAEAAKEKVVRIDSLEVLDTLGLTRRKGYRFSIDEFRKQMDEFDKQAKAAHEVTAAGRSGYQKKILELDNRLRLYTTLITAFDQPRIRRENAAADLLETMQRQQAMFARMQLPLVIPPLSGEGDWEPYTAAWTKAYAMVNVLNQQPNPATMEFNEIIIAYAKQDVAAFNKAVAKFQETLSKDPPVGLNERKIDFEAFFNHARLFMWASWMYVAAFALAALAWLGWGKPLNRAAFAVVILTFAIHTFALVSRIYISGRPPVTNLYSSAIFIGWGGVLLAIVLEGVYRLGIGNIVAGAVGFSTLVIADKLAGDGDTFTVLQAVLDTQFWLATHVTCITFGYTTTLIAGMLGLVYILGGVLTPSLDEAKAKAITRMIYGTLCFAIFFSFVGTVLGGLWADDSWGRFWGWDPKENGALIIVLWNALVLHARWDKLVKDRGLAMLAVLGNIAVGWSWFGVNQLSVGLHSYGFTEGVALALLAFVASQLAVFTLGMVPARFWWSTRAAA